MPIINKYLNDSLNIIAQVNSKKIVNLQVGKSKNHAINSRLAYFEYHDNKYKLTYKTLLPIGSQNNKELEIRNNSEIQLTQLRTKKNIRLYTEGTNLLHRNISIPGFENPSFSNGRLKKYIISEITSISTQKKVFYKEERFYRALIPLQADDSLSGNFTGWGYSIDNKLYSETLMKLKISNIDIDFYTLKKGKESFFIIDANQRMHYKKFLEFVNSILLSYAVLKGKYHGTKTYILSFKNKEFTTPSSLKTIMLAGGDNAGLLVHTTNPYVVQKHKDQEKIIYDKSGKIIGTKQHLNKYMVEFPEKNFSLLCELIKSNDGILRSVILLVNNNSTSLEMKIPIFFVALENITRVLAPKSEIPQLINDPKIKDEIDKAVDELKKKVKKVKKENRPQNLSPELAKEYNSNFERVLTKFSNYNYATNNKKLIDPFSIYGYKLTSEEEKLILVDRNKFLHGENFSSFTLDYEYEFKELFHIGLKLQKLITILLLKASGFKGYILNNPKIYDYISKKNLKESEFIKI